MKTAFAMFLTLLLLSPALQAEPSQNSDVASMSLQEALESDLGKICILNGEKFAVELEDESNCVAAGGVVQAAVRLKLTPLRSTVFGQPSVSTIIHSGGTPEPMHRLSNPLNSLAAPESN